MTVAETGSTVVELPVAQEVAGMLGPDAEQAATLTIRYSAGRDRLLIGWLGCLDLSEVPYPLEAAQAMLAANWQLAATRFEMDQTTRKVSVVGVINVAGTADLASAMQMIFADIQCGAWPLTVAIEFAAATGIVLVGGSGGLPELELADLVQLAGGTKGLMSLVGKRNPMAVMERFAAAASEGRNPRTGDLVELAGGRDGLMALLIESGRIPQSLVN